MRKPHLPLAALLRYRVLMAKLEIMTSKKRRGLHAPGTIPSLELSDLDTLIAGSGVPIGCPKAIRRMSQRYPKCRELQG